jgi:hypothetical protein
MTKAVFSPFYKPEGSAGAKRGSQYLRLASTSLGNTISVETFELQPFNSRYVLQTARTRNMYTAVTYLLVAVVVAAIALMVQSLIDPHGNLTKAIVPPSLQNAANRYRPMGEAVRERRYSTTLKHPLSRRYTGFKICSIFTGPTRRRASRKRWLFITTLTVPRLVRRCTMRNMWSRSTRRSRNGRS